MDWLDRILNSQMFEQFPDIKEMQRGNSRLSNPEFVGTKSSKNIEDRRNGISEEQRQDDLWNEEYDRVRKVFSNSLMNRPQTPVTSFTAPEHNMTIEQIMSRFVGK